MLGGGTAISFSSSSSTSSLFLLFVLVQSLSRDTLGLLLSALRLPICNAPQRKNDIAIRQG
jgi:hypothetical protein